MRIAAFLTTSLVVTALTSGLKRTEEKLRETKVRLEEAQRIAQVGWWERDFSTAHVALSDEACRILGVRPVDLPQWHGRWLSIIHPDDRGSVAGPRRRRCASAARVTTSNTEWFVPAATCE